MEIFGNFGLSESHLIANISTTVSHIVTCAASELDKGFLKN